MKNKSFTLIELLVVIALIGLLSSIVLVSVSKVREKARNTRRITDIDAYSKAFEMAFIDNNEYPDPGHTNACCLGDYDDDLCWRQGTSLSEDANLNNILDDYLALPADQNLICVFADACFEGYLYRCASRPNENCESFNVYWLMEGSNQSCGVGKVLGNYGTATYCQYANP